MLASQTPFHTHRLHEYLQRLPTGKPPAPLRILRYIRRIIRAQLDRARHLSYPHQVGQLVVSLLMRVDEPERKDGESRGGRRAPVDPVVWREHAGNAGGLE